MSEDHDSSAEEHIGDEQASHSFRKLNAAETSAPSKEKRDRHFDLHRSQNEERKKRGATQGQRSAVTSSAAQVWQTIPKLVSRDHLGLGRILAFWYTLNLPYNYLFDIHRFHDAVHRCQTFAPSDDPCALPKENITHLDPLNREAETIRCTWALNNPDIIVTM